MSLDKILKNKNLIRFAKFILIVLILSDIVLLTLVSFYPVNSQIKTYIVIFDLIVVLILIPDFIIRYKKAEDKREFWKYNGIDVLGMIPEIVLGPYTTAFRYLRLIKILVLTKMQIRQILSFLQKTKMDYGIFIVLIILLSGAIILFVIEGGTNPNINSFDDSLWYLVVSITTVGYGDIYPVTTTGRIIGTFIIAVGIAFVSFLTASITSYFVKNDADEKQIEINILNQKLEDMQMEMKEEMIELKRLIKEK